jgi:hypothetical protein
MNDERSELEHEAYKLLWSAPFNTGDGIKAVVAHVLAWRDAHPPGELTDAMVEAGAKAAYEVQGGVEWATASQYEKNLWLVEIRAAAPHVQYAHRAAEPAVAEPVAQEMAHCWACQNGQSLARGEGTHTEGTVEHQVAPSDWRTLSVTAIAAENHNVGEYVAQLEHQLKSLKENADFLRESVGACHMMISRDDVAELEARGWASGDLPHRLAKWLRERDAVARAAHAEEFLGPVTIKECTEEPFFMRYQCPVNVCLELRRNRILAAPVPDARVEAVLGILRRRTVGYAGESGIELTKYQRTLTSEIIAALDAQQKESK